MNCAVPELRRKAQGEPGKEWDTINLNGLTSGSEVHGSYLALFQAG